jgi:hypothetical protein
MGLLTGTTIVRCTLRAHVVPGDVAGGSGFGVLAGRPAPKGQRG